MKLHEHNIPKKQEEQKFLKTADVIRNTETHEDDVPFDPERDIFDADWQGMKDELEAYRQNNNWWHFSSHAMAMKLLAAEKVEVTSDGQIKITPKPKPLKTTEPLPERPV